MSSPGEARREDFHRKRVVLDTNVLVSAFQFGGKPRIILDLTLNGSLVPLSSVVLRDELFRILTGKFKVSVAVLKETTASYWEAVCWVEPTETVSLCRDEADNRVLECAIAGHADCIVTGDSDLLDLAEVATIAILRPGEFLTRFRAERGELDF